jgi:hypothetical protein
MDHGNFDILSVVHFLLYFFLGLYWKHKYAIVLLIGISWEIIEHLLVNNEYTKYLLGRYWIIPERYINDTLDHSITDIIMNMIGYTLGSYSKFKFKV